jgi:replicative DNA helicase
VAVPRDLTQVLDRTPPQNVELEMCVLGGIMLEPREAFAIAADYLSEDSFYLDGHALIFRLMGELFSRGIPPDAVALIDELRSRNLLEKVGGTGVVMGMLNSVPTAANVEHHARKVADKAHLRALIRGCTQIIEEAYRQELAVEEIMDRAEQVILRLAERSVQAEFVPLAEALQLYMEKLSERDKQLRELRAQGVANPRLPGGLPTGFVDLDEMTGGLRDSELTIIAARPSVGKTSLGLNMVHHLAVQESIPVAVFSLEMGVEQLAERLLSTGTLYTDPQTQRLHGVSTVAFQNPELTDQEWSVLQKSYERLTASRIYLDESSLLTIRMLKSKVRRLYAHYGVRCIVVDYLQLMTGSANTDGRVQEVSEISRGLKQIARELKIPVIALSQLSRQVEARVTKKPQLSDLRESGSIEQDADVVMFIHRPDYYGEKKGPGGARADRRPDTLVDVEVIVAKNRNGPTGSVDLHFFPEITRFLNKAGKWAAQW